MPLACIDRNAVPYGNEGLKCIPTWNENCNLLLWDMSSMNPLTVPNLYMKLWIVGRAVTEDATNGVVLIYAFRARCTTFCGHMVNVFKFIHTSTYSYGVEQGGPMSWCIKRPLIHLCFVPLSYNIWWKKINNNLETFMICVFKVLDFVHAFRFITWVYATLDLYLSVMWYSF